MALAPMRYAECNRRFLYGFATLAPLLAVFAFNTFSADQPVSPAPLGSTEFHPTSARPVGWRGDGTGRYIGADPPTTWSRTAGGEKVHVLWETKLPCYSWAAPIIVGDKIFVRSEPYDLICLDKKDGRILWIRSHGPQLAITSEEKKANPALSDIDALSAKLDELNAAYVAQGSSPALLKQKHDLQHQIDDLLKKAERKYRLPPDRYVESWSGYTASTPCTDGENIFFTSGAGITGCYDLNGNLKWQTYASVIDGWGEHGDPDSPVLCGDKFIVPDFGPRALDKATGKELWRLECKSTNTSENREQLGMVAFAFNGTDYAIGRGNVIRVSDGQSFFKIPWVFGAPIVHEDMIYSVHQNGVGYFFKMEPLQIAGGSLKATSLLNEEYPGVRFTVDDPAQRDEPMSNFWTASPVYHDGLVYCLSNWGRLVVLDAAATAAKDAVVYAKILPFDLKNPRHRKTYGCGIGASPALAGKYLYLMDNAGCTLVLEPGREYKLVAKNNLDYVFPKDWTGWEHSHWDGPRHETTLAAPVFEGGRIYIRGEQILYCIGE